MRTFAKINDRGRSDHEHIQNTLFGKTALWKAPERDDSVGKWHQFDLTDSPSAVHLTETKENLAL